MCNIIIILCILIMMEIRIKPLSPRRVWQCHACFFNINRTTLSQTFSFQCFVHIVCPNVCRYLEFGTSCTYVRIPYSYLRTLYYNALWREVIINACFLRYYGIIYIWRHTILGGKFDICRFKNFVTSVVKFKILKREI